MTRRELGGQEAVGVPSSPLDDEPSPRSKLIFGIVAIGLFMASVDQTIVATALTSIQHELHAQIQWSSWTITIYALGQVMVMPLAGRISDLYGRKRVLIGAVVVFTATSLICGMATNITVLVVLRAIQAIGGGSIMPAASGIVAEHFGRDRDRALGLFSSVFPIGGVVGPILGGVFVAYWSWRGIFLVNVPIGAVLIVLAILFIPKDSGRKGATLDLVGVAYMGVLILGTMFGITQVGDGAPILSVEFIVPELIAVAGLVLFVRHTQRAPSPFISMRFLVGHGFGTMNFINFLYGGAAIGFSALVPLYAQYRFGVTPLAGGTLLTARAVGMIAIAGLATFALRRTGYRMPMIVGFVLVAGGLVMMCFPLGSISAYLWLAIAAAITGLGMGLAVPAANNATLQFAGHEVSGVSGLRGMFRQAGSIVSVAIATAVTGRSANAGTALAVSFLVLAAVLLLVIPLIMRVPDHKGAW